MKRLRILLSPVFFSGFSHLSQRQVVLRLHRRDRLFERVLVRQTKRRRQDDAEPLQEGQQRVAASGVNVIKPFVRLWRGDNMSSSFSG
jgi:hypothetical protein